MTKDIFKLSNDPNDELDFMKRNVHIPSISPLCYERAYLLQESNVIELLDKFVIASSRLNNYNYLETLNELFEYNWVFDELKNLKEEYVKKFLLNILKNDPEWLSKSEKINIKLHVPVTGIERIDQQLIQIEIKDFEPFYVNLDNDDETYQFYSDKYVNYCKSNTERFKARLSEHERFRESLEMDA